MKRRSNFVLVGERFSGRSMAAKYLQDTYGYHRISLNQIIDELMVLGLNEIADHIDEDQFNTSEFEFSFVRDVFLMQRHWIDQVLIRKYMAAERYLIEQLENQIVDSRVPFVVEDVTTLREADMAIKFGAVPVHIETDVVRRYHNFKQSVGREQIYHDDMWCLIENQTTSEVEDIVKNEGRGMLTIMNFEDDAFIESLDELVERNGV